jgi:hypothetical protein
MPPVIETWSASWEAPLLNELQSTIKTRWAAFDTQLPTGKSPNEDYWSIKSAYDGIMSHLASVKTDTELTQNEEIKGKLDEFLWKLVQYLQSDTRRRELDGILADTNTQFKALRDKIYWQQQVAQAVQAENGRLKWEVAANKSASQPESLPTTAQAAAAVVGGTGIVATIESTGKNAEEAAKKVMKPLEKIKKWSSDIGSAWDAGWELVKKGDISKGIWLFFAVLFGGNLKDALAKYTGKADETAATDTPENPSQSDINEAQEKEKQKENVKINEATKLLVRMNAGDEVSDARRNVMSGFLADSKFRALPLAAIWPMFVASGYKLNDTLKNTLKPSMDSSGASDADVEWALKCMFSQEGLFAKQLQTIYQRAQEKHGQNASIADGILESYSSLGIFMKLASREPGMQEIDIGIHVDQDTGEIKGWAQKILGDRFSGKSLYYLAHLQPDRPVPQSSKDLKLDGVADLDEKSRKEIADFTDFTAKIRENYVSILGKHIKDSEISGIVQWNLNNISNTNALKMYALLDGDSDPTKMLEAQQFALLMLLGNIWDNTQNISQFNTYMLMQTGRQVIGLENELSPRFVHYAELLMEKTWNAFKSAGETTFDAWVGLARADWKAGAFALFVGFFSLRWTKTTWLESLIPGIKK